IAAIGGDAGRDAPSARERGHQRERVGQPAAVTVERSDGVGKPAQLATRAAGAATPSAVAPVKGVGSERAVVLAGAGRAAGAGTGHVDLVDSIEAGGRVPGENA